MEIPDKQHALQIVGPEQVTLNRDKDVPTPGPYQFLCRVVVVGVCFSDLKLLKQFSSHARKSEVISGIDEDVLEENPCYVPGEQPAVPGHEPVVEVVQTGSKVAHFKPGESYFIQADWRWLKTANSNGAFGYNFEGAMQEYTLLDERIVFSPEGECMLLPVEQGGRSASAFSLVEPWACVEESYRSPERQGVQQNGSLLVVCDTQPEDGVLTEVFKVCDAPSRLVWIGEMSEDPLPVKPEKADAISELESEEFDDIIYFGSSADTLERLFAVCADHGLLNLVLCGGRFEREVVTPLGGVHYQGIRLTGTNGTHPLEGYSTIPASGEIRDNDTIHIAGAGGPMGTMHVVRNIRRGFQGITVYAGDLSEERLATLDKIAAPAAEDSGASYQSYNPEKAPLTSAVDYAVIMVPVPDLVAEAVNKSNRNGIINIFAGIPTDKTGTIDMNTYVDKGLYFIGTSGSVMEDMRVVLQRVQAGQLDTNVSVAAVCGLDGAPEALEAVKNQEVDGKIMLYPQCRGLDLTKLEELKEKAPEIAAQLDNGVWTLSAENILLAEYGCGVL